MAKQFEENWMRPHRQDSTSDGQVAASPLLTALELSQIYTLIDSILPFEACLYYQVLPLHIEGSRLIMGRVDPDDPAAAEYVTKQLSYINYSLSFQEISSDWHRDLLSKYLNYAAKKNQSAPSSAVDAHPAPSAAAPRDTAIAPAADPLPLTYILDQSDELTAEESPAVAQPLGPPDQTLNIDTTRATAPESAPGAAAIADAPLADAAPPQSAAPSSTTAANPAPLALQVDPHYRDIRSTLLPSLPPQPLMQALLGKVLDEGIGRLYFERRSDSGRVLWSRDGVLQAVVDTISLPVFQGVINEFKRLMHLSLIAVNQPKQVEIERMYQGQRILLRLRLMRGEHGEEATLQILRGAALRFYQQQQLERLGRDALDAAQTLQHRLNDIRDRARDTLNFQPTRSETLPALVKLLAELENQVKEIEAAYDANQ